VSVAADRELGQLLRRFGGVADFVIQVLENDRTIQGLRKKDDIDKKLKCLIKFRGIGDEIPLPANIG
jgi:hypothetical protein